MNFEPELKKNVRLQIADEAAMLQDQMENLATQREVVRAHNRRLFGESCFADDGDDMGNIYLGDVTTITHAPPPTAAVRTGDVSLGHDTLNPSPSPTASRAAFGTLAKLGIGAALTATGAGGAIGIPMLLDALTRPNATVVAPAIPPVSGTRFELGRD